MKLSLQELAAIYKLVSTIITADEEIKSEEIDVLYDFFESVGAYQENMVDQIIDVSDNQLSQEDATTIVAHCDADTKQIVANLLAKVAGCDGEISSQEVEIFNNLKEICELPDPIADKDDDNDETIIPAFIVVRTNGVVKLYQTESTGYPTLDNELAALIGAERLEVVRYTAPLNAISEHVGLTDHHLVFLIDRNGYARPDAGDNMTGTLLYGAGQEIIGDIIFALESDNGYNISGIVESNTLLNKIYNTINNAVGGLLRVE